MNMQVNCEAHDTGDFACMDDGAPPNEVRKEDLQNNFENSWKNKCKLAAKPLAERFEWEQIGRFFINSKDFIIKVSFL